MRRRSAGPAVALFPFLAVLLCAMGALILLLLLLTRQIRENALRDSAAAVPVATTPVEEEEPPTIPTVVVTVAPPAPLPLPDPDVALRERLASLTAGCDAAAQEAERLRAIVAGRTSAVRESEARLASVRFDTEATRQRLAAREAELRQRAVDRAELLDAIARAEGTLAAARRAAEAAEPKVTILPYDGRYGTARRPILVECTGEAIRFLPEGIELTAADLEDFQPDYNPLLAGAVALREHWRSVDGPDGPKPYVLLLVREDGIAAYYAARNFLRSLGGETGYELVTDDVKLAVPEADPAARAACRDAVLEVLYDRSALLADTVRHARREPLFATGRFEVDPRDHDPTRPADAPFGRGGIGGPAPAAPPERSLPATLKPLGGGASPEPSSAGPSPEIASPGPSPPAPGTSPGESIAAKLARDARERRQREAERSSSELLEDALGEELPDFGGPGGKRRWGAYSPTASIALERPVAVEVTADRIVVGVQPPIPIGDAGVTAETVRDVIDAIDREANAWGRSPGQFYWSPRVQATVRPGGALHFDHLKRSLGLSGLRAAERIVLEPAAPAFLELSHAEAAP